MLRTIGFGWLWLCAGLGAGQACSPPPDGPPPDRPAAIQADGAFGGVNIAAMRTSHSSLGMTADAARGEAIRALGNGRISQRIDLAQGLCAWEETVLFVDCTAAESVLIFGRPGNGAAGVLGAVVNISSVLAPKGPVRLTGQTTVGALRAILDKADIDYVDGAEHAFGKVRKRDRYDVFTGCRMFHPDSPGARRR